jgi:hypothetical protein
VTGHLVYRDNVRSVYEVDGQPGVIDHVDYGVPQSDGTLVPLPMATRIDQALDGLKLIRDSTGTLTALQLSNAVRLLANVAIAVVRLYIGRVEVD